MRAVLVSVLMAATAGPWQFVGAFRGVEVYTRTLPGSEVRDLRAVGVVNAPIEAVRGALVDYERYPGRLPYVKEVRRLRDLPDGVVLYQRVGASMLADRDSVLRVVIADDLDRSQGRRFVARWAAEPDDPTPVPPGVVRMRDCSGSWELESLGPGQTRVRFSLHLDPGGALPAWSFGLANTQALPELFQTLERLSQAHEAA